MTSPRRPSAPVLEDRMLSRRAVLPSHKLHQTCMVQLTIYELIILHDALLMALPLRERLRWPWADEQLEITARRIAAVLVANGIS